MDVGPEFRDRVVLVTGGGRGIGRSAALLFAERGARVVVVDRDGESARQAASEITSTGAEALALEVDISDEAGTIRMVSDAIDRFGHLDVLFANAGIHAMGSVVSTSIEAWNDVLGVNLLGTFLSTRACIPPMLRAGGGAIVITASDSVVQTAEAEAAYTTAKHALVGLTRSIAVDFGMAGIRANVVVPGVTDTPGLRTIFSSEDRSLEGEIEHAATLSPLGRIGAPREIAEVAVFLCSDRASFMTGAMVVVDGGMTITYPAAGSGQ